MHKPAIAVTTFACEENPGLSAEHWALCFAEGDPEPCGHLCLNRLGLDPHEQSETLESFWRNFFVSYGTWFQSQNRSEWDDPDNWAGEPDQRRTRKK